VKPKEKLTTFFSDLPQFWELTDINISPELCIFSHCGHQPQLNPVAVEQWHQLWQWDFLSLDHMFLCSTCSPRACLSKCTCTLTCVTNSDILQQTFDQSLLSWRIISESLTSRAKNVMICRSSSFCWIYISIYPVGCRDLYVVIKISALEEVSSVEACYLLH